MSTPEPTYLVRDAARKTVGRYESLEVATIKATAHANENVLSVDVFDGTGALAKTVHPAATDAATDPQGSDTVTEPTTDDVEKASAPADAAAAQKAEAAKAKADAAAKKKADAEAAKEAKAKEKAEAAAAKKAEAEATKARKAAVAAAKKAGADVSVFTDDTTVEQIVAAGEAAAKAKADAKAQPTGPTATCPDDGHEGEQPVAVTKFPTTGKFHEDGSPVRDMTNCRPCRDRKAKARKEAKANAAANPAPAADVPADAPAAAE